MRLIDADKLRTIKSMQSADFNSIETIRQWIDSAPSIDIVRCGECKYTEFCEKKIHRHGIAYSVDFCSYGCREEE